MRWCGWCGVCLILVLIILCRCVVWPDWTGLDLLHPGLSWTALCCLPPALSYLVTPGLSSHVEPPRHPDMENIYKQNSDLVKLRESLSELRSQHLRGQNLQRLIQISSGVLVMSVVIICVLTLLTRSTTHSNTVRHRVVHSDPDWSHSLLVRKIQSTLPNPVNTLPSEHGETSQEDIFISVKTSRQFHVSRLAVILKTWFQLARRNTFFFTDAGDSETSAASGGHLVVTSCPPDHSRQALSCKMQAEFDTFIKTSKRYKLDPSYKQFFNFYFLFRPLGVSFELISGNYVSSDWTTQFYLDPREMIGSLSSVKLIRTLLETSLNWEGKKK